jgi:A/G-specific adenine glycosylase
VRLGEWFRGRERAYPWRGETDPYRVLVSEVMLQQTQASRVVPHYERFLREYPTVEALAAVPRADVVRAWAGLGYNRRAVALSEAARAMVRDHGGRVPDDVAALEALPGVGPYTAAAVAAFAFGEPVVAMDVNVRRVVARHRLGRDPLAVAPREARASAGAWLAEERDDPRWFSQALMDLSREICRPTPRCDACPLAETCRYRAAAPLEVPTTSRGQGRWEGSSRQVRGRVVAHLRERDAATLDELARDAAVPLERLAEAVAGLHRDGVVDASPEALAGSAEGTARLAG